MQNEKDIKKAAGICLESVALDPEMYRLGHTKASTFFIYELFFHSLSTIDFAWKLSMEDFFFLILTVFTLKFHYE